MIITIGRENGSGAKYIAEQLAKRLNLKLYDKSLIEAVAKESGLELQTVIEQDKKSGKSYLTGNTIFSNIFDHTSLDDEVFQLESSIIQNSAKGEDCIIIGRCSSDI